MKLKRQSDLLSKLIKKIGIGRRSVGQQSPHLQRTGQQDTGFEANHLDVFFLGHVVSVFEIHVILLPFANLKSRFSEELHDGRQLFDRTLRHITIGQDEHRVARKDGRVGIPAFVHGGSAPSQIGMIHQIVVQKGVVVICFQSAGRSKDALRIVLK